MVRFTAKIDGDTPFDEIAFLNPHDPEGSYNLREFVSDASDDELLPLAQKLADYEEAEADGRLVRLPAPIGSTVYRICPKCNSRHDGSCKSCAWLGTGGVGGCRVFGLWGDGQYPPERCTIVPWKVSWNNLETVLESFGKRIFETREEAEEFLRRREGEMIPEK